MKILIVLSAVVTACFAAPGFLSGAVGPLSSASLDQFRCNGLPCNVAVDPFRCNGLPCNVAADPFRCNGLPCNVAADPFRCNGLPCNVAADPFLCNGAPCNSAGLPAVSYAATAPYAAAPAAVAFPAVAPVALTSQFHAQGELGQYSYGYQGGPSAKAESRALDGSVSGGYSYVDANGVLQTAQYVSDPVNGFRVAATNLPTATARPVEDTPEVMQARAAHAAFVAEAAARSAAAPAAPEARDQQQGAGPTAAPAAAQAPSGTAAADRSSAAPPPPPTSYANIVIGPSGVPLDTPEVAAARAADAVAHLQAKAAALFG